MLGCSYPTALGYLSCLWLWAVGNAQDGDLSRFSDEEISYGARNDCQNGTTPEDFTKALVGVGLLDANKKIHDWEIHGTRLLDQARQRLEKFRSKQLKTSPRGGERGGESPTPLSFKKERKKESGPFLKQPDETYRKRLGDVQTRVRMDPEPLKNTLDRLKKEYGGKESR